MTEQEWLECTDPNPMLTLLKGKASPRKLRLFAAACYRHIERLLQNEESRRVVDLIERFAEGNATPEQVMEAAEEVNEEWSDRWSWSSDGWVEAFQAARSSATEAAATKYLADDIIQQGADYPVRKQVWQHAEAEEKHFQAAILREIFDSTFHPVILDPTWLLWNGGTILKLAEAIYNERAFDRLPILADALEEAGCTDPKILNHCRQPGEHVRGCWPLDLLLGKE